MAEASKKTAQTGSKAKKASAKTAKPAGKSAAKSLGKSATPEAILLPEGYRPTDDEEFMNPMQMEYFRQMLLNWRSELIQEAGETLNNLNSGNLQQPDMADRASLETDHQLELRTRDRERKLIIKIDEALSRIENGSYGFCQDTDEPIGLKRLMARPIAVLSLEAQERHERQERTHRED